MNKERIKYDIIQWVVGLNDDASLARLKSLTHKIDEDLLTQRQIVGVRANGAIITKSKFIDCVRVAEDSTAHGEFILFEELEKESENW